MLINALLLSQLLEICNKKIIKTKKAPEIQVLDIAQLSIENRIKNQGFRVETQVIVIA